MILVDVQTTGRFFRHKHLQKLRRFMFDGCTLTKYRDFRRFIKRKPQLKSLDWRSSSIHRQRICDMVAKFIPNIKSLELGNPNFVLPYDCSTYADGEGEVPSEPEEIDSEMEDDDDENEITDSDIEDDDDDNDTMDLDIGGMENPEYDADLDLIENSKRAHQGLSKLTQLETLWLMSELKNASDLADTLKMLTKCNTVKNLTMQFELNGGQGNLQENQPEQVSFPNFESLKTLRLVEPAVETVGFLQNFIASASNLNKCVLDYDQDHDHIDDQNIENVITQIVELTPKLEIFELRMPPAILDFGLYSKIVRIRRAQQVSGDKKPLVLCIWSQNTKNRWLAELELQLQTKYDINLVEIRVIDFCKYAD